MNKAVIGPVLLGLILLLPCSISLAGDEDMLSPYAEFDPETGFFLGPDGQIAEPGMQSSTNSTPDAVVTVPESVSAVEPSAGSPGPGIVLFAMVVVLAGAYFGLRHSRRDIG